MVESMVPTATMRQFAVSVCRISAVAGCRVRVGELIGFGKRAPHAADEGDRQVTGRQRDAPASGIHGRGRQRGTENDSEDCRQHDGGLLAGRLPAHEKALVARRGDFGKIHRDPTQFDAAITSFDWPDQLFRWSGALPPHPIIKVSRPCQASLFPVDKPIWCPCIRSSDDKLLRVLPL